MLLGKGEIEKNLKIDIEIFPYLNLATMSGNQGENAFCPVLL